MKLKSAIALAISLVLIVAVSLLAVNGIQIGKYIFKPVGRAIQLGLDLRGGVSAVYQAKDTNVSDFAARMEATVNVLQYRLTNQGITEAVAALEGEDQIRVEIPGATDSVNIIEIVNSPVKLEFIDPNGEVILTGDDIVSAQAAMYEDGTPVVSFQLNENGTAAFAEATEEFIDQSIEIQLDGRTISAPTVNSAITTGTGVIQVSSVQEAQVMASVIQSGNALTEIEEIDVRTISATFGANALDKAVMAGVIGVVIVMLLMIGFYRLPGLMASMALTVYILIVLYVLANFPSIQLTIPGIVGFILSIGVAVCTNIAVLERFNEEVRQERSLRISVVNGFKYVRPVIFDASICAIIAGLVLMYFGTGPIKGFAYTFVIGIITSFVTGIFVTKFFMRNVINLGVDNRKLYSY